MSQQNRTPERQYLTFTLNKQLFGIPIEVVREINQLPEITPVPHAPPVVAGVISLRDKVVPVVDLRRKFKLEASPHTRETCVIVIDGRQGQVAAIVDTVASVVPLRQDQIEAPPKLVQGLEEPAAVLGLGKLGQQVIVLLDITRAVDEDSIHQTTDLSRLAAS